MSFFYLMRGMNSTMICSSNNIFKVMSIKVPPGHRVSPYADKFKNFPGIWRSLPMLSLIDYHISSNWRPFWLENTALFYMSLRGEKWFHVNPGTVFSIHWKFVFHSSWQKSSRLLLNVDFVFIYSYMLLLPSPAIPYIHNFNAESWCNVFWRHLRG